MNSYTWLSPATGYRFTAVDVKAHKRIRSRMFSRAAWRSIAHSLMNITSRSRANAATMSSAMAVFGIALMSHATMV